MKNKTVLGVILSRLIGLLVFLILLAIANVLEIYVPNAIYSKTVSFLNNNLGLIILFSIIFSFGELFSIFKFPFNLPYPIFNGIGSIFLVTFLFRILSLIGGITSQDFFLPFRLMEPWVYPLVLLIVLIVGYVRILKYLSKPRKHLKKEAEWKRGVKELIEDINGLMNKINKILFKKNKKE